MLKKRGKTRIETTQATSIAARLGFSIQIAAGCAVVVMGAFAALSASGLLPEPNTELDPRVLGETFVGAAGVSCSDGTQHNQCVTDRTGDPADKPWLCNNGTLVEASATCGCPGGYYAWGDGSCTLRPHLRTFTHDLRYDDAGLVDTTFKATHFDEVFSHTAFKSSYKAINPQVKIGIYRNYSELTDNEVATNIPNWCTTQNPVCDVEDIILHFREDVGTRCDYFHVCTYARGYNESCSPSCTPAATATSRAESHVPSSWDVTWALANFNNPSWVAYNNYMALNGVQQGGVNGDILLTDNGDFYPGGTALDKSVEYYGIALDVNHPRIQESFDAQYNLGTYLSEQVGKEIPIMPNARSLSWYLHPYFYAGYQSLNNPIEIEVWLAWNDLNNPSGGVPRALTYNVDYLNTKTMLADSLAGQKFDLQAINESASNLSKSQEFMLSNYYLVNNKNLTFGYRDATKYGADGFWPVADVEDYLYIPAIEYNIGTPIVNTFGKTDVFGNTGTTEHFEFATGVDPSTPSPLTSGATRDYHVFARQYTNALVLAKWRTYGGYLGTASRTTHDLGGEYRRLNMDGTLNSTIITSITLENNQAAILIPVAAVCTEDWSCGTWSACSNAGVQTRTCTDANSCGTIVNRPAQVQTCTPPTGACTPSWSCTDWSSCTNNEQTRTCTDGNNCGTTPPPSLVGKQCGSEPPPRRDDEPPVGGNDDLNAPDTEFLAYPETVLTDHLLLRWKGTDDVTPAAFLRFSTRVDDGPWSLFRPATSRIFSDLSNGTHTIAVRTVDEAGNIDPVPAEASVITKRVLRIVTGAGPGGGPHVRVFDYLGNVVSQFFAYNTNFRGGISVATGDVNGDGFDEIITAPVRAGGPQVRIFNERGEVLGQFFAFPENFRGGLNVSSGDIDGDGKDEILVTPASGGGPMVRIFDGRGTLEGQFWAFNEQFRGGVNLSSGDIDEDGRDEVVVSPAAMGGPHVRIFSLTRQGPRLRGQFFAYPSAQRMGVTTALADIVGDDGIPEVITSPSAGGYAAEIRVFSTSGTILRTFPAASDTFRGGANVTAGDLYGFDNTPEILTSTYSNGAPGIFVFRKKSETVLQRILAFYAYSPNFGGGLSLALGHFRL